MRAAAARITWVAARLSLRLKLTLARARRRQAENKALVDASCVQLLEGQAPVPKAADAVAEP